MWPSMVVVEDSGMESSPSGDEMGLSMAGIEDSGMESSPFGDRDP